MLRLPKLRSMSKEYGARRHYAALDGKATRPEIRAYRVWRRLWRDAIGKEVRRRQR